MKVQVVIVYPKVDRKFPNPFDPEQHIPIELNIGCEGWRTNTAMRNKFCELLFAGAGNHPGLSDLVYRTSHDGSNLPEFDSGDAGINNVHRQWAGQHTRSMSVGDLVCIDPTGLNEWWLCCSAGFVLLEGDQTKSWLDFPREYGCCSFELRKWFEANNLPY